MITQLPDLKVRRTWRVWLRGLRAAVRGQWRSWRAKRAGRHSHYNPNLTHPLSVTVIAARVEKQRRAAQAARDRLARAQAFAASKTGNPPQSAGTSPANLESTQAMPSQREAVFVSVTEYGQVTDTFQLRLTDTFRGRSIAHLRELVAA